MKNPYPEFIIDESSGLTFHNDPHIYYKEGYEAKEKEGQDLYEALRKVMNDYPLAHYIGNNHPCTHCTALKELAKWEDK